MPNSNWIRSFLNFKVLGSGIYSFKSLSSRLTQASRTSEPETTWAGFSLSLSLPFLPVYQPHSLLSQISVFHVGDVEKKRDVATDHFSLPTSEERERPYIKSLCPYIQSHLDWPSLGLKLEKRLWPGGKGIIMMGQGRRAAGTVAAHPIRTTQSEGRTAPARTWGSQ